MSWSELSSESGEIRARAERGEVAYEAFVQQPQSYRVDGFHLYVVDRRVEETGPPVRFWGVVLLTGALLVLLVAMRASDWHRMELALGGLAAVVAGVGMIWRGRPRARTSDVPLAWADAEREELRIRERPDQVELGESLPLPFRDVREVLFSVRKVHVPGTREDVQVDGTGVFVRTVDGAVWPVIPGTLARDEAYRCALALARRLGVGVKQVGLGWR